MAFVKPPDSPALPKPPEAPVPPPAFGSQLAPGKKPTAKGSQPTFLGSGMMPGALPGSANRTLLGQ